MILAVVVGCFAILWPNVFYPMIQNNNETPPRTGKDSPAGTHGRHLHSLSFFLSFFLSLVVLCIFVVAVSSYYSYEDANIPEMG